MKGTLKTRTATIQLSRSEFIDLWYHLTDIINKDVNQNTTKGRPLTKAEETCKELSKLIFQMYDDWKKQS